jgi:tetratricopeptide (TPR) repeat protein
LLRRQDQVYPIRTGVVNRSERWKPLLERDCAIWPIFALLVAGLGCAAGGGSSAKSPFDHYLLGKTFLADSLLEKASEEFGRAGTAHAGGDRVKSPYAPALEGEAWVAIRRGDIEAARRLAREAVRADSTWGPAHAALGVASERLGDAGTALAAYAAWASLDRESLPARLARARLLIRAARWDEARGTLEEALALAPDDFEARALLARVEEEAARFARANPPDPAVLVRGNPALSRGDFAVLLAGHDALRDLLESRTGTAPAGREPRDIDGIWQRDAIRDVSRWGAMEVYPDGTFHPEDPMTRFRVALTFWRIALRVDPHGTGIDRERAARVTLGDVPSESYRFAAVAWAVEEGFLLAPGGRARPDDPASGPEALAALDAFAAFLAGRSGR